MNGGLTADGSRLTAHSSSSTSLNSQGAAGGTRLAVSGRLSAVLVRRQTARQGIVTLGLLTAVGKGLGFLRELAVAYFFGAGAAMDAYRVAETVSGLGSSVARQAFDVVGLPLLVERRTREGERAADRLLSALGTVALVAAALVSLALLAFAPQLVRLVAPSLAGGSLAQAALLVRLLVPAAGATVLSGLAEAWYSSRRQFWFSRLFDPLVNVVALAGLALSARQLGVAGLAGSFSAGHVVAILAVFAPLALTGRRLVSRLAAPGVKEFLALSLPVIAVSLVQPLSIAIARAFASTLPAGSVALLGYADRLFTVPCLALAATVGQVFYTKAAELSAAGDGHGLRRTTSRLIGRFAFVLIPASIAGFFVSRPLVALLYQRGAFSAHDAAATGNVLSVLLLGLFPFATITVLTAALRSMKDMKTPALAALAGIVSSTVLNMLLIGRLGLVGLGLASSAGLAVTAALLGALYMRRTHG